jgi:predicted esterase
MRSWQNAARALGVRARGNRPRATHPLAARLLAWAVGAAALAACAGCPVTQPQDTPVPQLKFRSPKTRSEYHVYVPSDAAELGPMPMVVTLHGTHGFDSASAQVKEWKALAEEHGFVVLAPELSSPQGILPISRSMRLADLNKDEARIVAAIEEVKRKYRINDKAVMITGFSAGGFPLYYVAIRHPELFSVLVARACNADMDVIEGLKVTGKLRQMPMLIFFSKTGINPISSNLNPIARQSWAVYRHLRTSECYQADIKATEGGHHRRPDLALAFWREQQGGQFPRRR